MAYNEMRKAVKASNVPAAPPGPTSAGKVESIAYDASHPGMARVGIRHAGPGKSKGKGGNLGFDTSPSSQAHIHVDNANKLKIGQKVHLRVHDGEYGEGTSDEFTQ